MNVEGLIDIHALAQYRETDPLLMCKDHAPDSRLICTRTMNHSSWHIAHSGEKTVRHAGNVVLGIWGDPDLAEEEIEVETDERAPLALTFTFPVGEGVPMADALVVIRAMIQDLGLPEEGVEGEPNPVMSAGLSTVIQAIPTTEEGEDDGAPIPIIVIARRFEPLEFRLMKGMGSEAVGYIGETEDNG